MKPSFIVYGYTHETKVTTHEYIGSSDEKLLTVVKVIWKIVDEYELLPVEKNDQGEEMALGREREPTSVVILANVFKDQIAAKSFEDKINEERQVWEEEESARTAEAQEETIAAALVATPGMNPDDVPVAAIVPRIFLCQCSLERCLNKVVGDILPTDTVLQQEQYMKNTTKPKNYQQNNGSIG